MGIYNQGASWESVSEKLPRENIRAWGILAKPKERILAENGLKTDIAQWLVEDEKQINTKGDYVPGNGSY